MEQAATLEPDDLGQAVPLSQQFEEAKRLVEQIEEGAFAGGSKEAQEAIKSATERFKNVYLGLMRLSIFSTNEEADDIQTGHLKYLLTTFYLGQLHGKVAGVKERLENIQRALTYYKHFLNHLENYNLLSEKDKEIYRRDRGLSAEAARAEKIYQARRDKELKDSLKILEERKKAGIEADEEVEREYMLLLIERCVKNALQEMNILQQELPLLRMMAQREKDGTAELERQSRDQQRRSEQRSSATANNSYVLTLDQRGQVQANVFRPGWIQPELTVEQAGEIEMQLAHRRQHEQQQREMQKRRERIMRDGRPDSDAEEEEEGEDEDSDEALQKARYWDDFKDNNRRGHGNTINQG
ncbi:Type 2A phosphatase-associated protein 42 [Balamuthia mandrillaris]